jgi:hypothetical protein
MRFFGHLTLLHGSLAQVSITKAEAMLAELTQEAQESNRENAQMFSKMFSKTVVFQTVQTVVSNLSPISVPTQHRLEPSDLVAGSRDWAVCFVGVGKGWKEEKGG